MRIVKIAVFGLSVIGLQTTVFARLNFFGVIPDLVLVSVIAFAVVSQKTPANLFSASLAFVQDCLSFGLYLNTIIKVVINNIVAGVKDGYVGDEYALTAGLVAVFTPAYLLIEGAVYYFFLAKQLSPGYFIFKMFIATIYNLMLVPLIFPLVSEINRE
ncbi:hypothetical protein A2625_02095 [candidate division WOR-1 bacterium RIFCSPHIGHO2_01_FULL_53_15]|uniref:Rod shape-determining protein MreD n=1 Tax=candidate division WOR-1 bacterium RIFCSPHIGHO2_01_FULL_53_15 TaxID=1802564 RepID=A0A1F4PYS2_UNCSA|nr:MAG: hypothetical protein A2625_02095 [candidate division WOR-1 bacterium RIFCSPHIGHO2_01_FULL_53_15]OGC10694.1 MAG: hypothetical protein A3D23_00785 [candidate division WOR-1 bacterium RIFCSPHIGHO2_02_FULL_53_26]